MPTVVGINSRFIVPECPRRPGQTNPSRPCLSSLYLLYCVWRLEGGLLFFAFSGVGSRAGA